LVEQTVLFRPIETNKPDEFSIIGPGTPLRGCSTIEE